MPELKNKLLIFVGMPGSGKSECVDYLKNKGFPSVYFGQVTFDEMKKRGLPSNQINERIVREDIRVKEGPGAYAERIVKQVDELIAKGQTVIIVESLYSWTEYKIFKSKYGLEAIVIAVIAPLEVRHKRLASRSSRPLNRQEVMDRDYSEIENIEKGGPIANADYYLLNNKTLSEMTTGLIKLLDQFDIKIT